MLHTSQTHPPLTDMFKEGIKTNTLDLPLVTPKKVLKIRGIKIPMDITNIAVICFRGKRSSKELIKRLGGSLIQKEILFHHRLYYSSEFNVLIIPNSIGGGPLTAILIEELYAIGVQILVAFGAGGSINTHIQPGDIFVARNVLCTDGTSKEYTNTKVCESDTQLLHFYTEQNERLSALFLNGLTTDSLYRETPRKIAKWRRMGADFINMEVSPFYVVSKVLGMKAIYVGLITDSVVKKWESTYWSGENWDNKNKIEVKIIESIKELIKHMRGRKWL